MTDPVFALEPDVPRNVRLARWLLFRLLSGLREGSLTVREGAQTFHFGDPAAALRAAGCEVYGSFRTMGKADGFAAGFDGLVPWGEFPEGFDLVILHRAADPAVLDG